MAHKKGQGSVKNEEIVSQKDLVLKKSTDN